MARYTLNPDSTTPVYRQLADQIRAQIHSGALEGGEKLPTVRELAEQMNLSCGTVKRVYDYLREKGDVEMTRRRGTFVRRARPEGDSRKLAAMTAIDQMMRQLAQLQFSPSEIQIFLTLKMREWGVKWFGISVAAVAPCPEITPVMESQIAGIGNVRVISCEVNQLREYPYSVDEQADVFLATDEAAQSLGHVLPDAGKLVRVAFAPQPRCVAKVARAAAAGKVAVLCQSDAFARIVSDCLGEDARGRVLPWSGLSPRPPEARALVVARGASTPPLAGEDMEIIPFDYEIDAGSMIYLQERVSQLRDQRQLRPTPLSF